MVKGVRSLRILPLLFGLSLLTTHVAAAADDDIESLIEKLEKLDTLVRQQQMRLEQQQQQLEKQQRQIATPTLYQANFGSQF